MFHRKFLCAVAAVFIPGLAHALELGFEGLVQVNGSDNVGSANAGSEVGGQLGVGQFAVFGEQKGTAVQGAFTGEIYSQRRLDDSTTDLNTITQFLGAVDVAITPRSLSWYTGDVLGGVRNDNALQPVDSSSTADERRNIFITGPSFEYEIDSFSRTRARLLYVNQSQNNRQLDTLYDAVASWEKDTSRGSTWGIRFTDIFTDTPSSAVEADFNRASASIYWQRVRGRIDLSASLGGTRYDTDNETLNGVNAQLRAARQLSIESNVYAEFTRDTRDQTLTTIESLLSGGVGVQPNTAGFFDENRLALGYEFISSKASLDIAMGAAQSNFRLLGGSQAASSDSEDQLNLFAGATYTRSLAARWDLELGMSYEKLEYKNRNDQNSSTVGSAVLGYQIARSFVLEFGYRGYLAEGLRTRLTGGVAADEAIDITENRFSLGLRWAPPTRASRDLTVELKSLMQ